MVIDGFGPGGAYRTRLLTPPDLRDLQALFERATDYFELATGKPPARDEAPRAFVAGPTTKQVTDKRVIGIIARGGGLVGVLDAIVDWPSDGEWTMGMLLLDPAHRGLGVGSAVLSSYEAWAAQHDVHRLRTAVVSRHQRGIDFLTRSGYSPVSPPESTAAGSPSEGVTFLIKRTKSLS